jgi:hypothetical protein
MTIRAIATVGMPGSSTPDVDIAVSGDTPPSLITYIVRGQVIVSDETFEGKHVLEWESRPPTNLSFKKADRQIRIDIAALILANAALAIDPDDIYFPMAPD